MVRAVPFENCTAGSVQAHCSLRRVAGRAKEQLEVGIEGEQAGRLYLGCLGRHLDRPGPENGRADNRTYVLTSTNSFKSC